MAQQIITYLYKRRMNCLKCFGFPSKLFMDLAYPLVSFFVDSQLCNSSIFFYKKILFSSLCDNMLLSIVFLKTIRLVRTFWLFDYSDRFGILTEDLLLDSNSNQ